jgi:hypothetical protein
VTTSALWTGIIGPSLVRVGINPNGLSPGTYNGTITITATDAEVSQVRVPVTLIVTAGTSRRISAAPQELRFLLTLGQVSEPQSIRVTSDVATKYSSWTGGVSWLTTTPVNGVTPSDVMVTASAVGLSVGIYTGAVQFTSDTSFVSVLVTLRVDWNAPVITGVAHAATFQAVLSRGAWASIFGSNLASLSRSIGDSDIVDGSLPTSVEGVSVTVDGKPAFVHYVSPTQLNILVPDTRNTGLLPVEVTTPSGKAATRVEVLPQAPGLFVTRVNGKQFAAAVTASGLVVGANAVKPGDAIMVFGTGSE